MDLQANTPEAQARSHLGESINTSTRALHAKLNKAILQHFPLALPPHTSNPSVYVSGLLHIAPIYLSFESLWHDILKGHDQDTSNPIPGDHRLIDASSSSSSASYPSASISSATSPDDTNPTPPSSPLSNTSTAPTHAPNPPSRNQHRIHALLHNLHSPLLTRSPALLTDIRAITNWSDATLRNQLTALTQSEGDGGASGSTSTSMSTSGSKSGKGKGNGPVSGKSEGKGDGQRQQHLTTFLVHLRQSVAARPHLLLAYAWVLYMALFSGGRVLRGVLEGVGEGFWRACAVSPVVSLGGSQEGQGGLGGGGALGVGGGGGGGEASGNGKGGGQGAAATITGSESNRGGAESMPLGFFRFDTAQDGEYLKEEFKNKFEEAGRALTVDEWAEVVREAGSIFEHMILLVGELHDMLGQVRSLSGGESSGSSAGSWAGRFAGLALRKWIWGGRAVKQIGEEAARDGELASRTTKGGGNEPADGAGALSLVVALLMVGVGLGVRYAWK